MNNDENKNINNDSSTIWDKFKENKNKTIIIILIIMGMYSIPLLIIHFLFKLNLGYYWLYAEWSAGDLIGYTAGMLAFIGTVLLGLVSIWQTNKANKTNDKLLALTQESERKSVLPFLLFNLYLPKFKGNILSSLIARADESRTKNDIENSENYIVVEDNLKREETLIKEIYFTITSSKITISDELNDEQKKKIQSQFDCGIMKENSVSIVESKYEFVKFYVENCGKGSAINVKCRFYKKGNEKSDTFDVYSKPFSLPCSQHLDLGLYFNTEKDTNGEYEVEFIYQDIYMQGYAQKIPITMSEKDGLIVNFHESQIMKL